MIPECRPFALELEPVLAGRILQVHYRRHINIVTSKAPTLSEPAVMNPRHLDLAAIATSADCHRSPIRCWGWW